MEASKQAAGISGKGTGNGLLRRIAKHRSVYLFILPGMLFLFIFSYYPMYGITLAFKDFKMNLGILSSPWADPLGKHFSSLWKDATFWSAFFNTFRVGFMYIITGFISPLLLALLMNEIRATRYKRVLQTVYTFPRFMSWVVCGGIISNMLMSSGLVNVVIRALGGDTVNFLSNPGWARPLLYITNVWKEMGWSAIIYMSAIASISPELYEAADVDGANRFQKMWNITWPGIKPTAVILLILSFGGIMNNGFDQIMNMLNPIVKDATEVLDTYIYRRTFQSVPNYGYSTAMGLLRSVVNFVFLIAANQGAKWLGEGGIM